MKAVCSPEDHRTQALRYLHICPYLSIYQSIYPSVFVAFYLYLPCVLFFFLFIQQKLDQLMRWADFHFASSQNQLQLIFKVILEYQVTLHFAAHLLMSIYLRACVCVCPYTYLSMCTSIYMYVHRRTLLQTAVWGSSWIVSRAYIHNHIYLYVWLSPEHS